MKLDELKRQVVGIDTEVPLLDGSKRRYVNFDNAASTPTLLPVQEKVNEFCKWYSNVHRGTGLKSQISSWAFDKARAMIADFVNAGSESVVIFCKNSTEAINKLARCLEAHQVDADTKPVILTTIMEHHSNYLPWRKVGKVVHVSTDAAGAIDMLDFDRKLKEHEGEIKLVAVIGASNVTGVINPIHELAVKAHKAGAKIVVDAAQLAPHRRIDIRPKGDPDHIDCLIFAAHKIYAPYGVGVLIADCEIFEMNVPEEVGGGTVEVVTLDDVHWKDLPQREEAGTPAIIGTIALAEVVKLINEIGFDAIAQHEAELTSYALERLSALDDIIVYGDTDPKNAGERLGVISFNVRGVAHALVAAILSFEGGIGVRNGCFCAQPYITAILNVSDEEQKEVNERVKNNDRSNRPGTVRISFGLYNTKDEIDHLLDMLKIIINGDYQGNYILDKERGEYYPKGFKNDFSSFFDF